MFKISLIFVWLIVCITSCSRYSKEVEHTLRDAGPNRQELEKVLEHYHKNPKDSLKFRAAEFLIANMPHHYTATGRQVEMFDSAFYSRLSFLREMDYKYDDPYINGKIIRTRTERIWNEVTDIYGNPSSFSLEELPDHQVITSAMLIENIDLAFEAYNLPWASHLSFDQFCEHVLPYRFSDEPLECWRPFFMKRYSWIADSVDDKTDPVQVCELINNDIASWFEFDGMFNHYPRAFSPSLLTKTRIGSCLGQAEIAIFAMRAMGLAVARNTIPRWGNRNMGHDFCSVLSKENVFIDFLGGELPPGRNEIRDKPSKVYRETFSVRQISDEEEQYIQILNFDLSKQMDVTSQYTSASIVSLDVPKYVPTESNIVCLCVFDNKNWVPVSCSRVKQGKCVFDQVGRDIVYLPVYYNDHEKVAVDMPFILQNDGAVKPLIPDNHTKRPVTLHRKYPDSQRMADFSDHMIGGKFQAANNPGFNDAVDLYSIVSTPASYFKSHIVQKGAYRYVRYVFPPVIRGRAEGNVAEIGFKGHDGKSWLSGNYIGSSEITKYQFNLLFDKKLDDYVTINIADTIVEDYPKRGITIPHAKTLWVGLDLKTPQTITEIGYCPRNDTNNLYERCAYELFYWDKGWISLGIKYPEDHSLVYDHVPVGALFLLHNHTEGTEERIFTYENGKQAWW